jgi:hypothetical protein
MADLLDYGLKYQSDFYNYFGKLVSVKIYRIYYDLDVINLRTSEVTITSEYVDEDTPIIGKGAKVVVIADTDDMAFLEDLLLATEKEFLCVIEYNSQPVFKGFTICDMNERQVLPYAAVTLQFTDYLHRTEGQYPKIIERISKSTSIYAIVNELLKATDFDFNLFVNSTLFEELMSKEANDTWLPQTYAQNSVFYSDAYTFDNIYDAVNKALKSFSAFLYSYNNKFVIERQEDITRVGDWVTYGQPIISDLASTAIAFVGNNYYQVSTNYNVYLRPDSSDIVFWGYTNFTAPTINNVSGDLTGVVNSPTQNYSAYVSAIDRLYPNGASGSVLIICKPGMKVTWTFATTNQTTCISFYNLYAEQFAADNITVTYDEDSTGWYVQLERNNDLDTGLIRLNGNFHPTIDTIQEYSPATAKMQSITLTGTYGTANITVAGSGNMLAGVPEDEYSGSEPDWENVIISVTDSLKQELNKQYGDWDYKECTQVVEYDSGLHTLILNLRDKLLDTLVFNDWPAPDAIPTTAFACPNSDSDQDIDFHTWYAHENLTNITVGKDYNDIAQWVHCTNFGYSMGWSYKFTVYANQDSDSAPTVLSIRYSMSTDYLPTSACAVSLGIKLRVIGGPYNNAIVSFGGAFGDLNMLQMYGLEEPFAINIFPEDSWYQNWYTERTRIQTLVDVHLGEPKKWDFSVDINLEKVVVRIYNKWNSTGYTQYNYGFWQLMGSPDQQIFVMTIMPPIYNTSNKYDPRYVDRPQWNDMFEDSYLGDVKVSVNAEEIANKITYVINKDFIKTEEVDLFLFDLENMNYGNALLQDDQYTRTRLWTSENSLNACPLYEIFAKCKFRKYGKTIHRLKGTILSDNVLKPFALLTDNTIVNEFDGVITFLLNGFTWDLVNGTYDIEAEEYTEDIVVVDGVEYDSEGDIVYPIPDTPIWGSCWIFTNRLHHPIHLAWDPVEGGMIGYRVWMYPHWHLKLNYFDPGTGKWNTIGGWVDTWEPIYEGTATFCVYTELKATEAHWLQFKVQAFNPSAEGDFSEIKYFYWSP